jgi:protein-disulfide isomerase
VEPQLEAQYVNTGKVRFSYNHFAFIGGNNGESIHAAEASECASAQGKFWEYHDLLFANQTGENVGAFASDKLKGFAERIGLDLARFNACYDAHTYNAVVVASNNQAAALGVKGTPAAFVIGPDGQRVPVQNPLNFNELKSAIDSALAKAGVP